MQLRLVLIIAAVVVFCNGCAEGLRNKQLESVAKDWSLVVRASQVIPVYPLTEDLQPGDVLLVNTPIEEQVAIYKKKGFLPLDQLLVRLYSKDLVEKHSTSEAYMEFYNDRYKTDQIKEQCGSVVVPPAQWQGAAGSNTHQWNAAPGASFPTYRFSVQKGAGINLAIPIHGVPFSLGLMKTGRASGTVTIADAKTFGLDNVRLWQLVEKWAAVNKNFLIPYGHDSTADRKQYLRVVSRVYVTGRVYVTVNNAEETGGQTGVDSDRHVDLLSLYRGDEYTEMLNAVNVSACKHFGAKVTVVAASSRFVSLIETFERPLVIGYIGFDMPILKNGRLGAPISTLTQLTGQKQAVTSPAANAYRLAALAHMYNALKKIKTKRADQLIENLDELAQLLPDTYPFTLYEFKSQGERTPSKKIVAGSPVVRNGFNSVTSYLGDAQTTVGVLENCLQRCQDGSQDCTDTEKQSLYSAKQALTALQKRLNQEPSLRKAIDYVFWGN